MRADTAGIVKLVAVVVLFTAGTGFVVGCGGERSGGGGDAETRARQVADAWDGSDAAAAWREGYHPMGEAVQLPDGSFHDEADKRAYTTQNFVLRGELPRTPRGDGQVRWESGGTLARPLAGAREAYESVARGGNDGPRLTVTGAALGEMTLPTQRGPATVPAWLFALEGYDTPLKRAAVSPSKLPEPPIEPVGEPTDELSPLDRLAEVAEDGRSVTVTATHGSCDEAPAVDVFETDDSVVLAASVVGTKKNVPCTSETRVQEVTVKLDRPAGARVLLDAFTGRPVPYGKPYGSSPSWSGAAG